MNEGSIEQGHGGASLREGKRTYRPLGASSTISGGKSSTWRNACKAFLQCVIWFDMFVRSFDTESVPRRSREPFDYKLPNFAGLQPCSRYLLSIGAKKKRLKIPPPTASDAISPQNGSNRVHRIWHTYRGQPAAKIQCQSANAKWHSRLGIVRYNV